MRDTRTITVEVQIVHSNKGRKNFGCNNSNNYCHHYNHNNQQYSVRRIRTRRIIIDPLQFFYVITIIIVTASTIMTSSSSRRFVAVAWSGNQFLSSTPNHRRILQKLPSTSNNNNNNKWSMMCTDSRELRFFQVGARCNNNYNNHSSNNHYGTFQTSHQQLSATGGGLFQEWYTQAYSTVANHPVLAAMASTMQAIEVEEEKKTSPISTLIRTYSSGGTSNNVINNNNINLNQQQKLSSNLYYYNKTPVTTTQPQTGYGPSIQLTDGERALFTLLRRVRIETGLHTTLRVAGGWVRDKLLATPEFQAYHKVFDVGINSNSKNTARLTSKFRTAANRPISMGRQGTKVLLNNENTAQPVDIDIALDDMLGREFADHLNEYLTAHGQDEVTVGMVLKNPEKSKHLETATMKVSSFWIDFVNLRAEEYTKDSRIPDLMRIGTAEEDAYRRDLTINALFYNINTGQVEDWTGRGFQDLRKGIVATPLPPLTTLLDDPLRVLRSIRFAARLRFSMDDDLIKAAKTRSVFNALKEKVSRERVGGELDLMLRSRDPVGAVRLLINLKLAPCVFPVSRYYEDIVRKHFASFQEIPQDKLDIAVEHMVDNVFGRGLDLMSTAHDHLADCRWSPPVWCMRKQDELRLVDDEEARRLLWYASFLKPLYDDFKIQQAQKVPHRQAGSKKANRCIVSKLLVGELKRPGRDAENVEKIIKAADEFTQLLNSGCDVSATMILLSDVKVAYTKRTDYELETCNLESTSACDGAVICTMNGRLVNSETEEDPLWEHAMEFRALCSKVMHKIGPLWRAALFLAISEELVKCEKDDGIEYAIEGDVFDERHEELRQGVMERFDTFAAAMQQVGLIGIWNEKPIADGGCIKQKILPGLPKGPAFRDVMEEQSNYMVTHPGSSIDALETHLKEKFPSYVEKPKKQQRRKNLKENRE